MKKQKCIIFDIDGVISDSSYRHKTYIDDEAFRKNDMQKFMRSLDSYSNASYETDKIIHQGVELFESCKQKYNPDKIIFCTARDESGYEKTKQWLLQNRLFDNDTFLIMRPNPQKENGVFIIPKTFEDYVYKSEVAKKIMNKFEICIAVDDKVSICEAYKKLNIPTIHFMGVKMPHTGSS